MIIAGLILKAQPKLICATAGGGSNYAGTIFQYTGGANTINQVYNFPVNANNTGPLSMTLTESPSRKLYGLNNLGTFNAGNLFEYDYINNTYTVKWNFTSNATNPHDALLLASNGLMYGITITSGTQGAGFPAIFSYVPGSDTISIVKTLPGNANPFSSLVQIGDNLLGLSFDDGTHGGGTIFQYNIPNNAYNILYDLPVHASPYGDILPIGGDTLYGLTNGDGLNSGGTIFKYIISSNIYSDLYDLPANANPTGSLIRASDGQLYGLTYRDGQYNQGTLFKYTITDSVYSVLHDFGDGTDGRWPIGSLMQASDGMLYGLTNLGGGGPSGGSGTIFRYNITTGNYTKEVRLNDTVGVQLYYGHMTEFVDAAPVINGHLADTVVCEGTMVSFIVNYTGISVTIQWQISIDGGSNFNNINGANSNIYTFTSSSSMNNYKYRFICTNVLGADTSSRATLTVNSCNSGIIDINSYDFSFSPDPTSGTFTMKNNYPGTLKINIINLLGENLKTFIMSGTQQPFDISDLAAGIYEVEVSDEKQALRVMKVVKE